MVANDSIDIIQMLSTFNLMLNLNPTEGTKKRLGFRRKQATSFSVHRSEEVVPEEVKHLVKQCSSVSSDGEGSLSGDSSAT